MREDAVGELACPGCAGPLRWGDIASADRGEVAEGALACERCAARYPVLRHVPRFVPEQNYCDNFALQWRTHATIQLDSRNGTHSSRDRLFAETRWDPAELAGQRVLECGSGAGRFTEALLAAGARVRSFDFSGAVDANYANNGSSDRLLLAQGDIYRVPFRPGTFDKVLCLGVLQHTPDPRRAFLSLPPFLRPGGQIVVDVYPKRPRELLHWKYLLRPVTRRMDKRRLYGLVRRAVPLLLPVSLALGRVPLLGKQLFHVIPVNDPEMGVSGLSREQRLEWSVLDTYDWYSPEHDHPQTQRAVRGWFEEAGLEGNSLDRMGVHVARGRRGASAG